MFPDSRRFSGKSGHLTSNHILQPSSPVQSYQCSHCVLIFESKLVLLEHLGEVHDLDVYDALRHATSPAVGDAGQNVKPKNDNLGDDCGSALQQEEHKPNIKPDILSKCDGKGQSPTLQTSPSPKPEGEAGGAEAQTWACKHCGRGFTSLVDLRVHERSHEAGATCQI
ncbi:hypothetical protein CRUP_030855 [Coryphaenoides rupestris]|nr:hypothetical protein CRUP_030855 [Coryphaenoides rupestris]